MSGCLLAEDSAHRLRDSVVQSRARCAGVRPPSSLHSPIGEPCAAFHSRRPCLAVERASRGRERVVEGLDRFSPCHRVENEAGSLAPVLDLDAEFILQVAAIPNRSTTIPSGLPMSEVIS